MVDAALRIQDFEDDFNPFTALLEQGSEGHVVDPYPQYDRLLRAAPVQRLDIRKHFDVHPDDTMAGLEHWTVLGFDACSEALANPRVFSNEIYKRNIGITFGATVTAMDGPEHGRYRRLFQAGFTPKVLGALRPKFQVVVDRLIERFAGRGRAELVHELALHFPFEFIMDLMDMDVEQRPVFHKLAMAQTCVMFDREHGVRASRLLGSYLARLIEQRRGGRSDTDLVTALANVQIDGERLPDDVLISFFRQLMNAGGDTSYHGFSNILAALFTHPDQLDAIRRDRSLILQAVDEGLRWGTPIGSIERGCAADAVLAGEKIPAGSHIYVCIAAANRDFTRWENAQRFDIFRPAQRHLAFGYGPHVCIGQHLAKLELQMALNTLLDRLPNLRLDPDSTPPRILGLSLRGADSVHVVWD